MSWLTDLQWVIIRVKLASCSNVRELFIHVSKVTLQAVGVAPHENHSVFEEIVKHPRVLHVETIVANVENFKFHHIPRTLSVPDSSLAVNTSNIGDLVTFDV